LDDVEEGSGRDEGTVDVGLGDVGLHSERERGVVKTCNR
jgi:hypothetical protein